MATESFATAPARVEWFLPEAEGNADARIWKRSENSTTRPMGRMKGNGCFGVWRNKFVK